jgi:hypothetical protein
MCLLHHPHPTDPDIVLSLSRMAIFPRAITMEVTIFNDKLLIKE